MWSMPEMLRRTIGLVRRVRPTVAGPRPPERAMDPPAADDPATREQLDGPVIAAGLTAFGLGTGSRIAVMGLAPEGDLLAVEAIGLLGAEAVVVPDHAHGPRLRLRLRGVRAVLTQSDCVPQIAAVVGDLPDLRHLWSWDAGGPDELVAAAHGRMPAFQD